MVHDLSIPDLCLPLQIKKTLLQKGISEPVFYRDLVYKFKRIIGKPSELKIYFRSDDCL